MDDGDQKLEVIRKLLAKAEGAATPDEADAYNDKAAKLMARHGVDSAMLAATDDSTRDVIESRRIAMTNPYSTEKASLVGCIARATGCRTVRHLGSGRGQTSAVTVMGFRSDLDRVEMLFTSLLLQATRAVVHQRPATPNESTAAFRRTWLLGFASEVYLRLADAEKAAAQRHDATADPSGPSAALVLADRRSLVDRAFDEQFNDLVPGRTRRLSGSGYKAGMEAGRRADGPTSARPESVAPHVNWTGSPDARAVSSNKRAARLYAAKDIERQDERAVLDRKRTDRSAPLSEVAPPPVCSAKKQRDRARPHRAVGLLDRPSYGAIPGSRDRLAGCVAEYCRSVSL